MTSRKLVARDGGVTMRHTKNSFGITKERMIIIYPDRISVETRESISLSWKSKMKSFIKHLRQLLAGPKTMSRGR